MLAPLSSLNLSRVSLYQDSEAVSPLSHLLPRSRAESPHCASQMCDLCPTKAWRVAEWTSVQRRRAEVQLCLLGGWSPPPFSPSSSFWAPVSLVQELFLGHLLAQVHYTPLRTPDLEDMKGTMKGSPFWCPVNSVSDTEPTSIHFSPKSAQAPPPQCSPGQPPCPYLVPTRAPSRPCPPQQPPETWGNVRQSP